MSSYAMSTSLKSTLKMSINSFVKCAPHRDSPLPLSLCECLFCLVVRLKMVQHKFMKDLSIDLIYLSKLPSSCRSRVCVRNTNAAYECDGRRQRVRTTLHSSTISCVFFCPYTEIDSIGLYVRVCMCRSAAEDVQRLQKWHNKVKVKKGTVYGQYNECV